MKICIFGGSFDPFHLGHFEILKCLDSDNFDLILLMPAFLSPFKNSSLFTAQERLQMCEIIAAQFAKVQVCDFEIQQNRAVYTIESLEFLQAKFAQSTPQFTLALGLDNFLSLPKWKNYEQILKMCNFVIFDRSEFAQNPPESFKKQAETLELDSQKCKFVMLENALSSTIIRQKLQNLKSPNELENLLPKNIHKHATKFLCTTSDS